MCLASKERDREVFTVSSSTKGHQFSVLNLSRDGKG